MSRMSNYHEFMAKFAPLKNPHEEDAERKSYKEAIPFGNPFKYVVRSKASQMTDNYEDQAFLSSFNQLPMVDRNKNERGVSPRGPSKIPHDAEKEKHRLSTQGFNLRSLQNALEESSGRSTPVTISSPSTVSGSTAYTIPGLDDIDFFNAEVKPSKKEEQKSKETKEPKAKLKESEVIKPVEKEKKQLSKVLDEVQKSDQAVKPKKTVNPYYFMVCNATGKQNMLTIGGLILYSFSGFCNLPQRAT